MDSPDRQILGDRLDIKLDQAPHKSLELQRRKLYNIATLLQKI